jgi:7-cyano-7-deazaguanine reductase
MTQHDSQPPALGPLGRATTYGEGHDPRLLFSVERAPQRGALGCVEPFPLAGHDQWTAWEASWLDAHGKPQVAVVRFTVPAASPRIVESKSVKLYLGALNNTRFDNSGAYARTLVDDLGNATGAAVNVELLAPADHGQLARHELPGTCIDDLPLAGGPHAPDATLLGTRGDMVHEMLYTRLFRSVCPVTAQPDYASIHVHYRGAALDRAGLLAYLVSFRHHAGFHEHCVERIAADLWRRCQPAALSVTARFTRRGGIDINPWRHAGLPLPATALAPTPVQ